MLSTSALTSEDIRGQSTAHHDYKNWGQSKNPITKPGELAVLDGLFTLTPHITSIRWQSLPQQLIQPANLLL